jgi:hypothetical protein
MARQVKGEPAIFHGVKIMNNKKVPCYNQKDSNKKSYKNKESNNNKDYRYRKKYNNSKDSSNKKSKNNNLNS